MDIRRLSDSNDPKVLSLVADSDAYLSALYPPESNHAEPLQQLVSGNSAFFGGYVDGQLAACAGLKLCQDKPPYGELKRVYVDPRHRGKALATVLIHHLEDYLSDLGVMLIRLEAGPLQPEALTLYRKLGYTERGPFGTYRLDPLSVFMEKTLAG